MPNMEGREGHSMGFLWNKGPSCPIWDSVRSKMKWVEFD